MQNVKMIRIYGFQSCLISDINIQIHQFFLNNLYINICNVSSRMNSHTKYPLPSNIQAQQSHFLNKTNGLFELFDKFQALPLFSVPQNSVVVDLQNITFGPGRYSIKLEQKEDLFFKIVDYCILYFIFEKAYDGRSSRAYERILSFIFTQDIKIGHASVDLTQEEIKVYLVKFLYILQSAKSKRKIVIEELNNLPQINTLLVALVKEASRHHELRFQQNAREVQKNIAAAFGIQFDLLSCDLFLFGGEFQVEIRHFDSSCEFAVTRQSSEVIQKIKQEFYLGESAYFMNNPSEQPSLGLESPFLKAMPRASNKVVKKDTIKSIEWVESDDEVDQEDERGTMDPEKIDYFRINQQFEINLSKGKVSRDLYCTQDRTVANPTDSSALPSKPKILNFQEIIKQQSQALPSEVAETVRSTTYSRGLQTSSTISTLTRVGKLHKPSFCYSQFSIPVLRHMPISKSVQDIRLPPKQADRAKHSRNERRVPTFILNRAKQNTHKPKITHESVPLTDLSPMPKIPRITFTYQLK